MAAAGLNYYSVGRPDVVGERRASQLKSLMVEETPVKETPVEENQIQETRRTRLVDGLNENRAV